MPGTAAGRERQPDPPSRFLPQAQRIDLLHDLEAAILRRALAETAALLQRRPTLRLTINLSASHLARPDAAEALLATLASAAIDPSRLILDLSEVSLLQGIADQLAPIHLLRSRGVGVYLDDFGQGLSSLRLLQEIPVDGIKLDNTVVAGLSGDPDTEAFLSAFLATLAHKGLQIVAEGVETPQQRSQLQALGCHQAQGRQFGMAVPLERLTARLPA
ncbi:EAL domain-containing protein [Synechococcus sp. RSCCF101]|nr:EAL domain-containing protein [Synechococcus sp. RSCCF101]